MKNNKAMGLINLILTISFIVVIVSVSIYFIRMKYYEARVKTIKTDMLQVQWKLKDYMDKQIVNGEEKKYIGTKVSDMKEDAEIKEFLEKNIITEEEYEKYYVLKDEELATAGLAITNYEGAYFIVNYENYEVINTKGCNYSNDKVLYKLTEIDK